jgi:hypothetical protein
MADIKKYPFARHLRGNPTLHVRHLRRGKAVHDGTGMSFWFRPLSAVVSEIPVDDRELPLLFHARTADFQDLAVQASVTFRVTDPAVASSRIDFSIDPDTGRWRGTPLEQVAGLLTETAQQQVLGLVAGSTLSAVLASGVAEIRDRIVSGLTTDTRLAETGIAVIGARVIALRPEPDVEKALRTPAREAIQQEADRSTYERRAVGRQRAAAGRGRGDGRADRVRGAGGEGPGARCGPGRRYPCHGRGESRRGSRVGRCVRGSPVGDAARPGRERSRGQPAADRDAGSLA